MTLIRSVLIILCTTVLVACSPSKGSGKGKPTPGGAGTDMGGGSGDNGGGSLPCSVTCASLHATCGKQGDGCGGTIDCGSCGAPDSCGGGGTPNSCGHSTVGSGGGGGGAQCVPTTCAALGINCGPAGDGCGGTLNCWPSGTTSCPNPGDICGGGGKPGVCGGGGGGGGPTSCTGPLCPSSCPSGTQTKISGYVYAPTDPNLWGKADPLPNALVYIPTQPLAKLPQGASCTQCQGEASGAPVVTATTDALGHFELDGTPDGAANTIPLVVQLGKWRREVKISVAITPCVMNTLTNPDDTRLPRKQGDGIVSDIPKIAFVTGGADPIECTLVKMGVDPSEFTNPGGTGRVNFYTNNGLIIDGSTPSNDPSNPGMSNQLTSSQSALDAYDMVVLDCIGNEQNQAPGDEQNIADYVNVHGGRVFASHFSYVWLWNTFKSVATWIGNKDDIGNGVTATIDSARVAGSAGAQLATWLNSVDGGVRRFAFGTITVNQVKQNVSAVVSSLVRQFMTYPRTRNTDYPLQFTFDTPVGVPDAQHCGRVIFSDFHVNTIAGDGLVSGTFSDNCATSGRPMSAQEKVLEYMLFDLSSCINPTTPPVTCAPQTCAAQGIQCGPAGDGCGNALDCGQCMNPGDTCGGGGTPYQCGKSNCKPLTCKQLGYNCGPAGDGCGGVLDCGTCTRPDTCGGSGVAGTCGSIG
jgi:hypothetical protein